MAANVLCVTRDQKFKETAKRIDISENQLEEILHKYFNDPAVTDKETYPSDEVILSKVQGETFFGDENQIALWNQRYSQPIQAANVQELNALKEHLEQFFPPESIGVKEKQNGTFEVRVKKPLREHDFLWRGVGSRPQITSNGDLVLTPYIDSLWGSYGLSFATNREEAENYGRRSSKNPFIIRISKEFLEKLYPFNPEGGTQSVGQRVIGDEYGGVEREERVVMDAKDSIIVPKEFYSIDRDPILLNANPARAAEEVLHAEAMYNVGDELPFSSTYDKFSSQDIRDYLEALVSLVGSEEEAYYYMAEAAMNNTSDASAAGRSYLELMEKTTPERRQELEDRITEFYNITGMYPEGEHVNLLGSRRDTRLDELIKKENVSINDLLSLVDSSSEYSGILELVRTKGERLLDGVQVKLIEGNQSGLFDKSRAFYSAKDKTIFINTLSNYRGGKADSVIMHEVMHAITVNRILGNRAFRAEFDKIIGEYQKHFYNQRYSKTGLNKEMASHYMEEFIADVWSNIDTINNLKSIKTNTKQTLWDKIKNFFTKIFRGSDGTLMAQASDALYRLLDQPELVSASDNYREGETLEVSTAGDEFGKQFSAFNAKFKQGTVIDGVDVSGRSIEDVYQHVIKKSGKGKSPASYSKLSILYRGYATKENTKVADLDETVAGTAKDYVEGINGFIPKYHFTTSREEAEGYAKQRTDKSEEEFYRDGNLVKQQNRHYTGDYAQVGTYYLSKDVNAVVFEDLHDLNRNPQAAEGADVIILKKGTLDQSASEFIVRDGAKNLVRELKDNSEQGIQNVSYQEGYLPLWREWAKQNPELIEELRQKSVGKTLTDRFAKTSVSQARALTQILQETQSQTNAVQSPQRQVIESIRPSLQRDFIKATQRNKQVDAMLSSEVITPTDISDAALVVSHWVSDMLTNYQTNPELVFDNFTNISRKNDWSTEQDKKDDLDRVSKMSRKEIVELIGPNNLLERARETIFKSEEIGGETGDVDAMIQADFFYDNFDGLLLYASPLISSSEDFVLKSIDDEGFESNVATVKEDDIFGDENVPQDRDTLNEVTRDMTEHWAVESRTLDVWKTATQQVRNALMQCYLLVEDTDSDGKAKRDENGNKLYKRVVNKFAQEEHVRALDATHQILNWVQGSINSQDMIAKLQDKVDDNPWITQIIDRLKDTSGKEADFRSQFFKTFYKYWQSYYVQLKNKKTSKVHTSPVNATPALNQVMDEIKAQYTVGAVPLFTSYGINTEAFDKLSKYADNLKKGKEAKTIDQVLGDADKTTKLATAFANVAALLGYPVKVEDIGRTLTADTFNSMTDALVNIRDILQRNLGVREYNPFKWGNDSITGYVRTFLTPATVELQDIQQGTFYANGKMYQGHVTPSYTTKMMDKLHGSQEVFEQFLMDEFANTEWFVTEVGLPIETLRTRVSVWRNLTLQRLVGLSEEERQRFTGHKVVLNYLGNREYMRNMTSSEYAMSVLTEFASEQGKSEETAIPAWYIFPMESNKPSEEFFKSFRFVGDTYKDTILRGMKMIFDQEISRIQTVMMRNLKEGDAWYIENFDGKNGRRFNFLPWMNKYLEGGELADSEAGKELQRKLRGDEKELKKNPINEKLISDTVRKETQDYLKERVKSTIQRFKDTGIYNSLKTIENVGSTETEINNFLENFVWNHIYAENSFLEMTVTDLAYYKHSEDLQKRLAQLHSPGLVGDRFATDYNGNRVTDGYFRTIHIEDLERKDGKGVAANVVDNLRAYFEQRIEQLPEASREPYRAFAENFMSNYDNFTVTDGQAFSVLTSLRKKSFVFGNWSREMETIWEKFRDGKFNVTDINTVSQVKKPFTYSQVNKPSNAEGAPIQTLKYGVQYKDSEALLMMAFGIIGDTDTGRPNILRAIMKVMEETHYALNDKGEWTVTDNGIDTAVFHSTVKTGYSTGINLNDLLEDPDGEAKAIERLRTAIGHFGKEYNEAYVNKIRVEDASQQLEVPGHFRDHDNIWGSQERYIIPSAVETTFMGQDVTYDVGGRKLSASEFKAEYEETTSQNIEDSLTSLAEELGLDQYEISKKDRNVALSQVLQKEILESPRYGSDLLLACSVDENTGEFRIPLGDPVQSKRVEQLINSVVKNRINKQKFKGGPSVLVTNWGSTKRLNIIFRDKDGNTLPVRSDWEKNNPGGNYDEFLKENQASPAWYECFASATTAELFRDFMDRDGFIDIESIEMLENGEELLKMIGYRIPTEDMYSIAPFRIVGFLPKEMGDAFMQPWEMPAITGEDHDVDKKNLLRKEIHIEKTKDYQDENGKENRKKLKAAILRQLPELQTLGGDRLVSEFLSGDRRGKATTDEMRRIKKAYLNLMFKVVEPGVQITDKGIVADGETRMEKRDARNNHIFDMTWSVLTNQASVEKILNTGSFEPQKNLGYKVTAMKANPNMSWEEINRMSTDEAKDIAFNRKYLPDFTTQMEYYENNSVAGNVLGQAAVQRIAHAILQGGNYGIVMPGDYQFTLAGQEFKGFVPIDNEYAYSKAAVSLTNDAVEVAKITQESIGKTLGNHVGAAADAVKDPVLNLLNINTSTFRTYATMLRLGVPFEVAGLMLSSKAMDDVLAEHKKRSLVRYVPLAQVIDETLTSIEKKYGLKDTTAKTEELTYDELIDGLRTTGDTVEDNRIAYKILTHWRDFEAMASASQPLTVATRYNSVASAVGPQVVDNLIQEHKANTANTQESSYVLCKSYVDSSGNTRAYPVGTQDVLSEHPILNSFSKAYLKASDLLRDMPAQSRGFEDVRKLIPESLQETFYNDRGLLLDLSDFYQSYLLVKNGVVNPANLEYFVDVFPKEFLQKGYKEKYAGNPFVDAIKPDTRGNRDGEERLVLKIDTSGMKQSDIDRIKLGWAQLHKENPNLSRMLFEYNFAIAGIGYSPKTFMNCLPTQVKEAIPGYVDTYRHFPELTIPDAERIVEQFILNNVDEGKLVPYISKLDEKVVVTKKGLRTFTTNKENSDYAGLEYFKTSTSDGDVVYKLTSTERLFGKPIAWTYEQVLPLGDNGSYLEISTSDINRPLHSATALNTLSPRGEENGVQDSTVAPQRERVTDSDRERNIMELRQILQTPQGPVADERLYSRIRRGEITTKAADEFARGLADRLRKKGVPVNENTILEIKKRLC